MKKRYLLGCILLLVGCNENKTDLSNNEQSFSSISSNEESTSQISSDSSIESNISNEESSSSIIVERTYDYYGYLNAGYSENDYSRRVAFDFECRDLVASNNEIYYSDLAKFSALLAGDTEGYYTFIDGKNEKRPYLMKQIGMDDYEYIDLLDREYNNDKDDVVGFTISHKKETISSKDYEVILVSISGTRGNDEWRSNLDFGADIDKYYELTGNHPEWKNKDNNKGLDVTANRVEEAIEEYVAFNVDDYASKVILITGHSRGGGVANLVGKIYEDKDDYKSFSYCFACPGSTMASNANEYKTIFNIINRDDLVPALPPNFTLYGTTIKKSIEEDYLYEYNSIHSNKEYVSANGEILGKNLRKLLKSREDLYTMDYENPYVQKFYSLNNATIQYNEDLEKYKRLGLEDFVEITKPEKNGLISYSYETCICPQYVVQLIRNYLDGGSDIGNLNLMDYKELSSNTVYVTIGLYLLNSVDSGGVVDSHMITAYYTIAENYE